MRRTLLPAKLKNGPKARGRPVGLLTAWLKVGVGAASAEEHKKMTVSLAQRCEARAEFTAMPGSNEILDFERDVRPGEGPEPVKQP